MKPSPAASPAFKRRDHPAQLCFDFAPEIAEVIRTQESPKPKHLPLPAPQSVMKAQPVLVQTPVPAHSAQTNPIVEPSPRRALELPAEIELLAEESRKSDALSENHYLTDARVAELIGEAANLIRPNEVKAVRVRFLPFRATLYSFKLDKRRTALVKFHLAFRRASDAVVLQAAQLMLCRSRKLRATLPREDYDRFVRGLTHGDFKLPGARKASKKSFDAQGAHRHLGESFQRVNDLYFRSQLKQPELCWSPIRARRILGSYQERNDRLIVSRVFDSPNVPLFVLDFLMYHELLHKFLGVGRRGDGRRCMHGAEFKRLERQYQRYEEAEAFIKKM